MLGPPPATAVLVADVPADFTIERRQSISLLLPRCGPSDLNEIVVCGRHDVDRYRLGAPLSSNPTLMEEAAGALSFKLGPIEGAPGGVHGAQGNGVGYGIKIRF